MAARLLTYLGLCIALALDECQRSLKSSYGTLLLCLGGQAWLLATGLAISCLIDCGKAAEQGCHRGLGCGAACLLPPAGPSAQQPCATAAGLTRPLFLFKTR